jgi:hypothetical protein
MDFKRSDPLNRQGVGCHSLASWKLRPLPNALGLEQVPMIVPRDDLKARADGESDHRHERVPESYAIDVVSPGATNDIAHAGVTGDEAVENR